MATSKALRTPPPRTLDNYVISTRKLFEDFKTAADSNFLYSGRYIATYKSVVVDGGLLPNQGYSETQQIGFDLKLNGKVYKEFIVASCGWMLLKDPDGGTTGSNFWHDVLNSSDPNAFIYNNSIILSNFAYDHILLAPWFDGNFIAASSVDELQLTYYSTKIGSTTESNIYSGADTRSWPYDSIDHGVRCLNGYDAELGRYLLVRWTTSQSQYDKRLKFEIAIYENGRFEYRYWPSKTYEPSDYSPAVSYSTVGIFWSGPSQGSNKFRDLASTLDYNSANRSLSSLGGVLYNSGYSEISQNWSTSSPYSNNVPYSSWPKNGGIITFSPPTNSIKLLPKKITSLSSKQIVRQSGMFDDRKTINFNYESPTKTYMPSTLPSRLLGDTGDIDVSFRQLLFVNGGIEISAGTRKAIIDSELDQLEILQEARKHSDLSFNESQKDYLTTTETTGFYSTGSTFDIEHPDFSSPLKSKTQFSFSLPVSKKTTMPALTASLYYYNVDRQSWDLIDPDGYRPPEPMIAQTGIGGATSLPQLGITYVKESYTGDGGGYLYKVTETSRGFDAVGKKIVSGSKNINFFNLNHGYYERSFQTDDVIGQIYNCAPTAVPDYDLGNKQIIDTIVTRDYKNSLTDNQSFCPLKSQALSFPSEYPFLIEKVTINVPMHFEGEWFNDRTTCNRAFGDIDDSMGVPSGAIDFGGPGITFALMCSRKNGNVSYFDLIASGTITHNFDNISSVEFYKNPGMNYYCMRPAGFKSFSNPSTVVEGTYIDGRYQYTGNVRLDIDASVAGGITFARNDRSLLNNSSVISSNRNHAISLLTTKTFPPRGKNLDPIAAAAGLNFYNTFDTTTNVSFYLNRAPVVYIQQVSPLSRGSTKIEFNGNSLLGGNVAAFEVPSAINNPLYISSSGSLSADIKSKIDSNEFVFEGISMYSAYSSKRSPYLVLPGDKLTLVMSKTRPVIYKAFKTDIISLNMGGSVYGTYSLTGSHGSVMFNTGSIDITVYGSYVKEGMGYNP